MKDYQEILAGYKKRQRDTVVDAIATGLTYVDELVVEGGLLEETGLMNELTGAISGVLPFVIIAVQEGSKVVLGLKPSGNAMQDGAYRFAKTGVALGVGSMVAAAGGGLLATIPVTMGVRALFDQYKSKALTGARVKNRITRLQELNTQLRRAQEAPADGLIALEEPVTLAIVPN